MNIHHATAKKAEANDVKLTVEGAGENAYVKATWKKHECNANDAKQALADMLTVKMASREYPAIKITQGLDFNFWQAEMQNGEEMVGSTGTSAEQALGDLLEQADELGLNPEEGAEEEDRRHAVVPEKYKEEYKARGNANHCGDWLASTLDGAFVVVTEDGPKFDVEKFEQCLVDNEVDMTGKWANLPNSGQRGWVGRYRMNGRQKLELRVAQTGILKLHGKTFKAPADEMDRLWDKHPNAAATYSDNHKDG